MSYPFRYTPLGFGSTAISSTAGTLTLPSGEAWPADVRLVLIHVGGAAINYRDDGTAPIAETAGTSGYPVAAGGDIVYEGDPTKFQAIARNGGTAALSCLFYG